MKTLFIIIALFASACSYSNVRKDQFPVVMNDHTVQGREDKDRTEIERLEKILERLKECQVDPFLAETKMCERALAEYRAASEHGQYAMIATK